MWVIIFGCLVSISAGLAIGFRQKNNERAYAFFKPLTTIWVIVQAIVLAAGNDSPFSNAIIIGLVFSLIGDVFLLKDKLFTFGLSAFLLAHTVYLCVFITVWV
jgi:uncharacterized membrane protein YhhN